MKITILTICLLLFASKAFAYETQEEKNQKYVICYGQMTNEHKRSGLDKSNRMESIKIKEKTCEDYAEGRIFYYPGKDKVY